MGFGYVEVIWRNWAKSGPNMGVAATRGTGEQLGSTTPSKV